MSCQPGPVSSAFLGFFALIVYLWRHRKDKGIGWYRGCGLPSPHEK